MCFVMWFGEIGIDLLSYVVIYDDKGGVNVVVCVWWMLCVFGYVCV